MGGRQLTAVRKKFGAFQYTQSLHTRYEHAAKHIKKTDYIWKVGNILHSSEKSNWDELEIRMKLLVDISWVSNTRLDYVKNTIEAGNLGSKKAYTK